jgi:hypothetical protein
MNPDSRTLLLRAWLATAATDFLFASTLSVVAYHSTVARVWQGVASTVLGPSSFDGGARTIAIGIAMHCCVALAWTSIFFALYTASPALRRIVATTPGLLGAAAVYGPLIWIAMSFVVIPLVTKHPLPTINARWIGQAFGHICFVALPMIAVISRGRVAQRVPATA